MLDLENYSFREGVTPLSAEELNRRFYALVRRLHDLETLRVNWDAAVAEVQAKGVQRIDEAVRPLLDALSLDLQGLVERGEQDLESQALAVAAKLDEVEVRMAQAEARFSGMNGEIETRLAAAEAEFAQMTQSGELLVTQPEMEAGILSMTRDMWAGMVLYLFTASIPVLGDGLPVGLELDGAVADLAVYPRLMRIWCGAATNATAANCYRCTAGGARDAAGGHIKLPDLRGEFLRCWDHGRGVDSGRALGSAQAADNAPHSHGVDPPATYSQAGGVHRHQQAPHLETQFPGGGAVTGGQGVGNNATAYTEYSAEHQHLVDIQAFTSGSQGTEGRPRTVAAMAVVLV